MSTKKAAPGKTMPGEGTRRCIGSVKFGIEAHDAPIEDFPVQPSQKDGYGRMCRPHWKEYTSALRRASTPRKEVPGAVAEVERARADKAGAKAARTGRAKGKPEPIRTKPARKAKVAGAPIEA